MSSRAPWSVKGIDPKAREIAKDRARRSGMTLGEWLSHVISGGDGARREALSEGDPVVSVLKALADRLDAAEREQALRLDRLEAVVEDIRAEQAESAWRVKAAEQDGSGSRVEAIRSLEIALNRVASRLDSRSGRDGEAVAALRREISDLEFRLRQADEARGEALERLTAEVERLASQASDAEPERDAKPSAPPEPPEPVVAQEPSAQAAEMDAWHALTAAMQAAEPAEPEAPEAPVQAFVEPDVLELQPADMEPAPMPEGLSDLAARIRQSEARAQRIIEEARQRRGQRLLRDLPASAEPPQAEPPRVAPAPEPPSEPEPPKTFAHALADALVIKRELELDPGASEPSELGPIFVPAPRPPRAKRARSPWGLLLGALAACVVLAGGTLAVMRPDILTGLLSPPAKPPPAPARPAPAPPPPARPPLTIEPILPLKP